MRTTKSVTISLPPKQLRTAERLAKKQNRTMSELFREGLRRLEQEEQEWRPSLGALRGLGNVIRLIQQDAKRAGLDKMTKLEINAEVESARKEMQTKTQRSTNRSRKRSESL